MNRAGNNGRRLLREHPVGADVGALAKTIKPSERLRPHARSSSAGPMSARTYRSHVKHVRPCTIHKTHTSIRSQ
jgi:hypothetical protein